LSFWSGAPVIVNRKSRKDAIVLDRPFVCVTGCIPPDMLGDLADERGREDGFLHRILFGYPEPVPLAWPQAELGDAAVEGYGQMVETLLEWRETAKAPEVVTFTAGGHRAFLAFAQALYTTLNDPTLPPTLHGPFAKLEGYGARLALILQEARRACGETNSDKVEKVSVLGAAALIHYFQAHARRVYGRLQATPEDQQVEQAVAWIQAHGHTTSARDLLTPRVARVKTASEAKALLYRLQERGYGTVEALSHARVRFTLTDAP
jgi:hypothetical protein